VLQALDESDVIGLDLETTGLTPRQDRIRLLSLATERGTYLVDCFTVDPRPLFDLLSERTLILHNAAFDLGFLAALGFAPGPVRDTMLLSRLLYGTRHGRGFHGLESCTGRELGRTLDKTQQKSDWSKALTPEQLHYAASDAGVLPPLYEALSVKVQAAGMAEIADIEHRCVPATAWLAQAGVPFDKEAWAELARASEREAFELAQQLDAGAPVPEQRGMFGGWNWDSPQQVQEAFAAAGCPLPDTKDETLAAVDHPLAAVLRQYRGARKRASTYGMDWLANAAPDGRVYPSWNQLGADSGRMSCSDPNVQNLPRTAAYRRCFRAPPGRVLVKADYSQIELRIAAKISGDKAMLAAYQTAQDLHTLTAQRVLGRDQVSKEDRQIAKSANFGLLYGMGAKGYQAYAQSTYGVELTLEQARQYRQAFFSAYPGLAAWHRRVRREHAGETRTLAGRRRLLDAKVFDTLRLNSPVQGTGADGLKRALALLWERRNQVPGAFPILAVHDEIVVECDRDQAEAASTWLRRAMLDGMAGWLAPVPIEVELTVAPTWGG
jgi:DNA polymerase-1